jgi:hypothetical protein
MQSKESLLDLFNTSTPEKAFKTSVRPLAFLFVLQSIGLFAIFTSWPPEVLVKAPVPFIPDPIKPYFLIGCSVFIFAIGIGLLLRSKPIWLAFLAYITVGPLWIILGIAFNYFPGVGPKIVVIPIAAAVSALIAAGLFLVTKPAFKTNC